MYKQQDQSNSSVDNLYRPIPQDCVAVRLNDYVHRYWKATLRTLTAERRQTAAHVLTEHFGFTVRQLSELFGCSRMTVYRDLRSVEFYCEHVSKFREESRRMEHFLRHYAQYLGPWAQQLK